MSIAVRNIRDLHYHAGIAEAVERAERRIWRGCCAACGQPAEGITCVRPECWRTLRTLPVAQLDRLLLAYDRQHPAPSLLLDAAGVAGGVVGLAVTVAAFGVVVYPMLRWVVGR